MTRAIGRAIRRSDGLWLCLDDAGNVFWDVRFNRAVLSESDARALLATYAPIARRYLRVVGVARELGVQS